MNRAEVLKKLIKKVEGGATLAKDEISLAGAIKPE
jgi:hypothetical protein